MGETLHGGGDWFALKSVLVLVSTNTHHVINTEVLLGCQLSGIHVLNIILSWI